MDKNSILVSNITSISEEHNKLLADCCINTGNVHITPFFQYDDVSIKLAYQSLINNILSFSLSFKTNVLYSIKLDDLYFKIVWFVGGNTLQLEIKNNNLIWNEIEYNLKSLIETNQESVILNEIQSKLYTFNLINS